MLMRENANISNLIWEHLLIFGRIIRPFYVSVQYPAGNRIYVAGNQVAGLKQDLTSRKSDI